MKKTPKQDGMIKPTATSSGQKSHIRRNPMGHTELVIARKGKKSEGTLNELSVQLMELLEEIAMSTMPALSAEQLPNERATNQPFTPQLVSSSGDQTRAIGDTVTDVQVGDIVYVPVEELKRGTFVSINEEDKLMVSAMSVALIW
jgi:hypothetical protein